MDSLIDRLAPAAYVASRDAIDIHVTAWHAEDCDAAVVAGEEPVVERRAHPADVEEPGGRGSEADADSHARKRTDQPGIVTHQSRRAVPGRTPAHASARPLRMLTG